MAKKIKVLLVAAECDPLAKVGGLADVIGSLPQELNRKNVDARVIMPFYGSIDTKSFKPELIQNNIPIIVAGEQTDFNLFLIKHQGVLIYLIQNNDFLSQGKVYTWKNHQPGGIWEKERFLFFTESTIQALPYLNFWPDILHLNDWHTGLMPKFLSFKYTADSRFAKIKTIFTIHNISIQGVWGALDLLPWLDMTIQDFDKQDIVNNDINAMLFGIRHSHKITTVSPTYAKEITTKKFGMGMEKFLRKRKADLRGILNGIDINKYNPASDPYLDKNYSFNNLPAKKQNKQKLLAELNIAGREKKPLLGVVSRLTQQKGIDWIVNIAPQLKKLNANLIILGTGNPEIEKKLVTSAKKYSDWFKVLIKYDAGLAQKIYAASDIFLIPSRFEPCGLTQMIAMRYGTIPVVRAIGGLKDTVEQYCIKGNKITGNGFLFKKENSQALLKTIKKACAVYKDDKKWHHLQQNAMKKDFSWNKSANEYVKLYKELINN